MLLKMVKEAKFLMFCKTVNNQSMYKIKSKSLLLIHLSAHLLKLLHDAAGLTSRDRERGRGAAVIGSMSYVGGGWL